MTQGAEDPQIAKSKHQTIVETAYSLFKRHGFHATGIDRIIAEAGVAKMTMYRKFPTKDDLIAEVLDWRARRFQSQLDRMIEAESTPSGKIMAIFNWYGRWFESPDFHGCLFAHAIAEFSDPSHPVFVAASKQKAELQDYMATILRADLDPDSASSVATAFLTLIEGATLLAQLGKGAGAIDNARRTAALLLKQGAGIPL